MMCTNIYHDETKMDTSMFYLHSERGFISAYQATNNVDFVHSNKILLLID